PGAAVAVFGAYAGIRSHPLSEAASQQFSLSAFQCRPLRKQITLRSPEFLALIGDPALKRPALDAVNLSVDGDLKHRRERGRRQATLRMRFGVRDVNMGRIKAAGSLQVEAVAPALGIDNRHRAPMFRHGISISQEAKKRRIYKIHNGNTPCPEA